MTTEMRIMMIEVAEMLKAEKLEPTEENISKMMLRRIKALYKAKNNKELHDKMFNNV
jgi:hypothetical protein